MVKRWLTCTLVLQTRISPKMILISDLPRTWWKMIELLTQVLQTKISPKTLYIQVLIGHGERWMNSTQVLQTRISPKFYYIVEVLIGNGERWLNSTQVLQTRNSSNMFCYSSDVAWTWWKMIELYPGTADQNTYLNIYLYSSDLACTRLKMIDLHLR